MITQNYLMIPNATNVVDSTCMWDGDVNTWTPPADTLMLVQATTPAMIWEINSIKTEYVLTEVMGMAEVGFTWDGTVCTTNQPKPIIPTPKV